MDNVTTTLETTIASSENNWPYTNVTGIDPTTGISKDATYPTIYNNIGFEYIAKNIASLPYRRVISDDKKTITKVFYISDTKSIKLVIDLSVKGKVVKTISGDTGFNYNLIKTSITVNNVTDVVYSTVAV